MNTQLSLSTPDGTKPCPKCSYGNTSRKRKCFNCGEPLTKPKKNTFTKEKRAFRKNMLRGEISVDKKMDSITVGKIFERFKGEEEFLSLVKPPFKLKEIKYLLTPKGVSYLETKLKEFHLKPAAELKVVEDGEKIANDNQISSKPSIRNFLNG